MADIEAMRRHILELSERYDINIEWQRSRNARALPEMELIQVPPILSAISYAVALHEFGHILGLHQQSRSRVIRERWAWQWARRHALLWTPGMERCLQRCMAWYE